MASPGVPLADASDRRSLSAAACSGGLWVAMAKTVLLTLGRLPKALELARCLHGAGCKVLVAEPFGLHLTRPSRAVARSFQVTAPNEDPNAYAAELTTIIDTQDVDLVVPISEEVLHVARVAAGYHGKASFFCPPFKVLHELHDKAAFIELAGRLGLRVPETARAGTEAADALRSRGEAVIKPALGCSGVGLSFVSPQHPPTDEQLGDGMVVQRRIRGREISTLSLARRGKVLTSVVYDGLVHAGTVAVAFRRCEDCEAAEAWVAAFVERTGYSGFIAFDIIVDETGAVFPIECNPRLTSGLHFFDHAHLAAALLNAEPSAPTFKAETTMQEGHTALAIAYSHILQPKAFVRRFANVFTTRDVLWSGRDPLPFLMMTPASWPVLQRTLFGGKTLAEAATADIEWRPDSPLPPDH